MHLHRAILAASSPLIATPLIVAPVTEHHVRVAFGQQTEGHIEVFHNLHVIESNALSSEYDGVVSEHPKEADIVVELVRVTIPALPRTDPHGSEVT